MVSDPNLRQVVAPRELEALGHGAVQHRSASLVVALLVRDPIALSAVPAIGLNTSGREGEGEGGGESAE